MGDNQKYSGGSSSDEESDCRSTSLCHECSGVGVGVGAGGAGGTQYTACAISFILCLFSSGGNDRNSDNDSGSGGSDGSGGGIGIKGSCKSVSATVIKMMMTTTDLTID